MPSSPSDNVDPHVAWKCFFFVENENARNAAWAVDIKKSAKRSLLCLGAFGISETGRDLSGISLGIKPTREIKSPILHVLLVLRTLP